MKVKMKTRTYEEVLAAKPYVHQKPVKQWIALRWLVKWLSTVDLLRVGFEVNKIGMEKLGKDEPCLILMNHSCFSDMEIAGKVFGDRPYAIVCTKDALIGKSWLMRILGCISTTKYITDMVLVQDMVHVVKKLKSSIIMYPEACYSFDGTGMILPDSLSKCVKLLKVPVVMIQTHGAFLRNPLYNELQLRKMKVTADVKYVLSPEDIQKMSAAEIKKVLEEQFTFDSFRWQQENKIAIKEKFRADGLNRVLYKCPHCHTEGKMSGKGIHLTCQHCGAQYELTEYGFLESVNGESKFTHVPDWFKWQRECVKQEIENGSYKLDVPVDIYMMVNAECVYKVGDGNLKHTEEGFYLTGCDGKLEYSQKPDATYTINSDFYWYEIGDVICIGDAARQYYCIPKQEGDIVAKTKLAAEEMYKLKRVNRKKRVATETTK